MNLQFDGELLTVSITVIYRRSLLHIDNVIIDTGSSHTILTPDVLEKIGVIYENGDPVYEAYGIGGSAPFYTKVMDEIRIGPYVLTNHKIDVGILPKHHNGLLGLDILMHNGFMIDFQQLILKSHHFSLMKKKNSF
ncbi:retropepsin-like aspartic protease [Alteribacillus bidgolensis]|uniref:Aspartyl protease n=1 Tax=Alteribacillus bidgolensis TaxID=930129 RepID=A0A1G8KY02_9BACI|nr:retropepsin-like aspartic protease [Alteribacillus bidgolensis]SDI48217.1 Aspartyl protease [Alteribacillus bidgolensis]